MEFGLFDLTFPQSVPKPSGTWKLLCSRASYRSTERSNERAQIRIFGRKNSGECGAHGEPNDTYDCVSFLEISELESSEFKPVVPARYNEVLNRASVARQQRSTNTEACSMKFIREKRECLRGVAEAMKQKDSARS